MVEGEIGGAKVNMAAIQAYRQKAAEYKEKFVELEKVSAERETVRSKYDSLRKQRYVIIIGLQCHILV